METIKVKEMMVPLEEYATVNEEATLYDAVLALEQAREQFSRHKEKHRAILVIDDNHHVVGKLSQLDVIRGLEPGYKNIKNAKGMSRSGFTSEFLRSMMEKNSLWQRPLASICQKATQIKVKNIMYTPEEEEYIDENATLNEAVHHLIMGHHQSLLVMGDQRITGILRLTDVFEKILHAIKACEIDRSS